MATGVGEKKATSFGNVVFRGQFRDYQQTVLERTSEHLSDKKVHIVAAPGSGKTVLGLELVNRLGAPALVLSPSVTIRQQWGERFEERFLPEVEELSAYVSFDLKDTRLITSVTYQALHAAMHHLINEESLDIADDEDSPAAASPSDKVSAPDKTLDKDVEIEDFKGFDLVAAMKQAGVKVLCLDEAHHLRSEWHRALTAFIKEMKGSITIISLTATPPYDSTPAEWKRYEDLCGPIDEEIFVPELVMKKTLCPHQDYLYFSYPTEGEKALLSKYRRNVDACLETIRQTGILERVIKGSGLYADFQGQLARVLKNEKDFFTLFRMAEYFGVALPDATAEMLKTRRRFKEDLPWRESLKEFESALQFVVDNPEIFSDEVTEEMRTIVSQHGLMERRRVKLLGSSKISRMLASSMGKLSSVTQIALNEQANMGENLRMLVLTDYIKKELLHIVGTDATLTVMGAVPLFETIRRAVGERSKIAILSGTLVVVPDESREGIAQIAADKGATCRFKELPQVHYSEAVFSSSNKDKVAVLTEAFQQGLINIMVGTKALLGEGWDSPCINTLILATFVGSFMLSNQMRGRAIRIDKNVPDKAANIWHLVTLEPIVSEEDTLATKIIFSGLEKERELDGADWETIIRRFDCFMGPAYSRPVVESGIERIDILTPPFDSDGIDRINAQMEARARDRAAMAKSWLDTTPAGFYPVVGAAAEMKVKPLPTTFVLSNILPVAALVLVEIVALIILQGVFRSMVMSEGKTLIVGVLIAIMVVLVPFIAKGLMRASKVLSPKKMVTSIAEAVLASLRQTGYIKSMGAKIRVAADPTHATITFGLRQATVHEQNVFAEAMSEMLSPIQNPKYLLVKSDFRGNKNWHSYACPTTLSSNKEDAEVLRENLSHLSGKFDLVLTYTPKGREILWRSCCWSYVNLNEEITKKLTTMLTL